MDKQGSEGVLKWHSQVMRKNARLSAQMYEHMGRIEKKRTITDDRGKHNERMYHMNTLV